jgi:pyruvate dehydrogenase E2 component (dihydrolipoyllysine-residue acetyltransferase)
LPTQVIMPALEMAQDNGKLLCWLKSEGDAVKKGEPLMEIETDKAAVEIEAPADGILRDITAQPGDSVPVGKPIALIFAQGEAQSAGSAAPSQAINASPVARQIAKEHGVDLTRVKPHGGRIEKTDVLAYISKQVPSPLKKDTRMLLSLKGRGQGEGGQLTLASPKARRLARERGIEIGTITGSGPDGAIVASDVVNAPTAQTSTARLESQVSTTWRLMAERTTASWTGVPHFFLLREVNASRLIDWRASAMKRTDAKITYTDLLVRLTAVALTSHRRVNARWANGTIEHGSQINIGLAVATEEGLVVPVIYRADQLSLKEIAARREDIVARAGAAKLRLEDLRDGTFTISNLGMYGVDVFNAIINAPQAAILAVGRIADRVVPVNGAPAIQPVMMLSLSCDHRVVDGARGAQFLQTLADLIEEPLNLLD